MISIAILVEGNRTLGLGHVVRCAAMADAMKSLASCDIHFFAHTPKPVENTLMGAYPVSRFDLENVDALPDVDIIITDLPNIQCDQLTMYAKRCRLLVSIDDSSDIEFCSDILIKPGLNPNFRHRYTNRTQYLCGGDYIILREAFSGFNEFPRTIKQHAQRLLICFGGSDPNGLTERVCALLRRTTWPHLYKQIVLGSAFEDAECIKNLVIPDECFQVIEQTSNIENLFWESDMALISGGTLMYEAVALGTPTVVLAQNAEQAAESACLADSGAVLSLGIHCAVTDLALLKALQDVMLNRVLRECLSRQARKCLNASGAQEIANAILNRLSN